MTQTSEIAIATTETTSDRAALTTCAQCSYFAPDQGVRGWCQAFDKPARPHHEKTKACDQEIEVLEHNSHIAQPTTGGQQSEIEHPPYPAQSYKRALTERERHMIAAYLAWENRYFVSAEEIQGVEQIGGSAWVSLSQNRTMPISASIFKSIRHEPNSEHYAPGSEHCDLNSGHCGLSSTDNNTICRASDPNPLDSGIEIDSDDSPLAPTYRVWFLWHFLGSFHQSPVDNKWLTSPTYGRDYQRHTTSDEAIAAIAALWNHAQQLRTADQALTEVAS